LNVLLDRACPEPFGSKRLPWGCHPSSRHQLASSLRQVPKPAAVRPRRFSRPRRFDPPPAFVGLFHPTTTSRVHSSGAFPPTQPWHLIDARCPLVVTVKSLLPVAQQLHNFTARPQGFAPCPSPLSKRRGLAVVLTRSPPEFLLLQVFFLNAVRTPSRPHPLLAFEPNPSSRARF